MELRQFVKDTVVSYGSHGDNTLEYIGLVFKDGLLCSPKVYHTQNNSDNLLKDNSQEKTVWDKFFGSISDKYPLKLCDISHSRVGNADTLRIVADFENKLTTEQAYNLANNDLDFVPITTRHRLYDILTESALYTNTPYSALIQIGTEVDCIGNYLGLKYYIRPTFPKRAAQKYKTDSLISLYCKHESSTQKLEKIAANLAECDYLPMFIGVNDYGNVWEKKLYFGWNCNTRLLYAKAHSKTMILCKSLMLNDDICNELITCLDESKVYAQGAALSDDGNVLRIYLKEISPKLL